MVGDPKSAWWAVARSEEVTAAKPLSVEIGDEPVVLWRDTGGVARALEDRCPHRRAPLSLGCIRDNGWIQCGYHGWSYDGETGRLRDIPNMKDQQKFPPLYRARAFAVAETDGLVRVNLDAAATSPPATGDRLANGGTVYLALGQDQFVDALFDDPALVLQIRGVRFTPYPLAELHDENGRLVMEHSCRWALPRWPAPFSSDFPLSLLTSTDVVTGETEAWLRDASLRTLLHATIAPVPAARGATAVRWRWDIGSRHGAARVMLQGPRAFSVRSVIDGTRLRAAKPSVSSHGRDLRARHFALIDAA